MTTFVLVPGAWLGGWIWDGVADALRRRGHAARAITLTGVGERADLGRPDTRLAAHVADVVSAVREADDDEVVLVAHSYASAIVPGTLRALGDRIAHTIYVDTGPLGAEQGVADFEGPDGAAALEAQVEAEGDGWRLPPPDFASLPASRIEGLTEEQVRTLQARATPHPFGTYTDAVGEAPPHTASFVAGNDSRQLLAMNAPGVEAMARMPRRDVAGGHYPMLARPDDLADALVDLAHARR